MSNLERDLLLRVPKGALEDFNLSNFWDGFSFEYQKGVLEYFENTPNAF